MSWPLFQNSMLVAGGASLLATTLGGMAAIFSLALPAKGRSSLLVAAAASLALPPFLVTNTWLSYFGLAGSLKPFIPFDLYSLSGTILLISILLWPIPFFFIFARLARLQAVELEQESLLRRAALFRYLIWPHARSAIFLSAAAVFVLALSNFSVPALLQTKVYAAEVWLSFNTKFNYVEALQLSWPLIIPPLLLLMLINPRVPSFFFRKTDVPAALLRERYGPVTTALLGCAAALTLLLSLALPLLQLIASPRTWSELAPAIAAGKSATLNSLLIAFGAATVTTTAGVLLARRPGFVFAWLIFLVPGVLLGVALIFLLNRPPFSAFYQSLGMVFLAFGLRYFAWGWAGARLARKSANAVPAELVRLHGGGPFAVFRLAEWPQTKPLLLATFYIVYLFCLWEVETLILIVPPGRETLSLRVFNMLHYGHASQVDALCVWLLALALLPLAGWSCWRLLQSRLASTVYLSPLLLFAACSVKQEPANSSPVKSSIFGSVQIIGSRGTGPGQFNKPRSLAVDREDNLYVVDLTGRVQKFSESGEFLLLWQMPETDKGKAKGMIQDQDGNVVVIEPHYSRVNHHRPDGKLLAQWGEHGTEKGRLLFPRAAAVNSKGEIYLSEYGQLERIHHFTHRGEQWIRTFGTRGTAPGELNRPEGLGIDADDLLYVADSCNHRVQIFSAEGKHLGSFGRPGDQLGELSYPYDVRIDREGNRYVCEFGNSRVQVFDEENSPVEIIGGAGAEPGELNNPWAIALDSKGNLYVADSLNHRVQKFHRKRPLPGTQMTATDRTTTSRSIAATP